MSTTPAGIKPGIVAMSKDLSNGKDLVIAKVVQPATAFANDGKAALNKNGK